MIFMCGLVETRRHARKLTDKSDEKVELSFVTGRGGPQVYFL
jgi:hypothetical protein